MMYIIYIIFLYFSFSLQTEKCDLKESIQKIVPSIGDLEPQFDKGIFNYSLSKLTFVEDQLSIYPLYHNSTQCPIQITTSPASSIIEYFNYPYPNYYVFLMPQRNQTATIKLNFSMASESVTYTINVQQYDQDDLTTLRFIKGIDSLKQPVGIYGHITIYKYIYEMYLNPKATAVTLKIECAPNNELQDLNGNSFKTLNILRTQNRADQKVEFLCAIEDKKAYYMLVLMDEIDEIPPPKIFSLESGSQCLFDSDKFYCQSAKSKISEAKFRLEGHPRVTYSIKTKDENKISYIQDIMTLQYDEDLFVVGQLGSKYKRVWAIVIETPLPLKATSFLGSLLGCVCAALLLSLLLVIGATNALGIGTPIGTSDIASALTFVLQFFSISACLIDIAILNQITKAVKWTTLLIPLPLRLRSLFRLDVFNSSNLSLKASSFLNDEKILEGCFLWSIIILLWISFVRYAVNMSIKSNRCTQPHHLRHPNWEQTALQSLAFPLCVISSRILFSLTTFSLFLRIMSLAVLSASCIWGILSIYKLRDLIKNNDVVWVWNSSIKEFDSADDDTGYWLDVRCDQLFTQPVNRSYLANLFPWHWVTTVADITPMYITSESSGESNWALNKVDESNSSLAGFASAKDPRIVNITCTAAPNRLCPGDHLICGLLRTSWLDFLFTYYNLTHFYNKIRQDIQSEISIPLTVKLCQLTGRYAGGKYYYFFDGTKIPYMRVYDILYRCFLGCLIGSVLATKISVYSGFLCSAIVSILFFIFVFVTRPYTRYVENMVMSVLLWVISLTSLCNVIYMTHETKALIILCFAFIGTAVLGMYAVLIILATYSAVICPPMNESRFLEGLANCTVNITDHFDGWGVDIPAYNKLGTRDLKTECTFMGDSKLHIAITSTNDDPTLEFSVHDMLKAFENRNFPKPVVCLYMSDDQFVLGYQHVNIYSLSALQLEIAQFLSTHKILRSMSSRLSKNIAEQVEIRSQKNVIITLTIVPPNEPYQKSDSASIRSESTNIEISQRS